MKKLLLAIVLVSLGASQGAVLSGALRINTDTTGTNTKSSAITVTAQTNLFVGSITISNIPANKILVSGTAGLLGAATNTGTGSVVLNVAPSMSSPSIATPVLTGSPSLEQNQPWTFSPGATREGINVGSVTANPSSRANGGLWYRSDLDKFYARIGGADVEITAAVANTVTASANFATDGVLVQSDGTAKGVKFSSITITALTNMVVPGNLTVSNNVTILGTLIVGNGTSGFAFWPDADGDHGAGIKANATTTTDVILVMPAAPFTGMGYYTASGTNFTMSANKVTLTQPASGSTITIVDGKTLTVNNTITLAGTDSTTITLPTASATVFSTISKSDVLQAGVFASDAGANDTYTCTYSPAITAYVTGTLYRFSANTANTGAATININGLGAKTIKKAAGGITTDLADNDIRAGQWVEMVYDGTNMQMVSLLGNAPAGGGTVTSVGWTGGIVSIATATSTPAFTIAGTSGGVPYFNSASTWTTSAALAANAILIGGGAGAAPASTTTGTGVLTALGNTANATGGVLTTDGTASPTNKTFDTQATGNTLKWIDYDKWVFPQLADEAGAIITTNNAASELNGHATFSGSGATNANWVVYEWVVPDDIDTAVDLKVARFKLTTAGTSTSSATFNVGMQDMADSADQETISLANFSNWVAMTTGTLTSPAAKDGFTISATTLTSWKSNLTAGHTVHIMICRDGANDANNDAMTDKYLVVSYGRTQ